MAKVVVSVVCIDLKITKQCFFKYVSHLGAFSCMMSKYHERFCKSLAVSDTFFHRVGAIDIC